MGSPLYQLQFHGKTYSATDLSTLVLRRLKEDAEARLGDAVDRAVITVPAYFADPQRKATIEAGQRRRASRSCGSSTSRPRRRWLTGCKRPASRRPC